FMLAAPLMEWYLQTRTNTPINYKTILPLQASRPSSTARRPICALYRTSTVVSSLLSFRPTPFTPPLAHLSTCPRSTFHILHHLLLLIHQQPSSLPPGRRFCTSTTNF
ncbi:hypothetical protein WH47_05549, partial [Habropoda laboriosa]